MTVMGTCEQFCRALGDANFKEGDGDAFVSNRPDVRHLLLTPADTAIVIASDGLFDVVSDQQAADSVLETFSKNAVRCHNVRVLSPSCAHILPGVSNLKGQRSSKMRDQM